MAQTQFNQPASMPTTNIGTGNLWFPNDLENYLYHITFDFRKFTRRDITDRAFYGAGAQGSIRLPIPGNMIDNTAVGWGDQSLNPVLGALIDYGSYIKNNSLTNSTAREQLQSAWNAAKEGGLSAAAALLTSPLALAAAKIKGTEAISAIAGLAINPFMTVLFETPTFKRHSFQWRFSPRNRAETDTLRELLARFRFNMLPSINTSSAGLLLNYPNMCYVGLYPDNTYLYKFKPCVITAASINYAPSANPAFFKSSQAPVDVLLVVELLEMEYWVQEDVAATWNTNLPEGGRIGVDTTGQSVNAQNNIDSGVPGL